MAKIQNPQDQNGIGLINQTIFDGEVTARTEADISLQENIDKEIEDRKAAIESEKERAMNAESNLADALSDEVTRAQEAESALNDSLAAEVLRATEKENRISAVIDGEVQNFSTDKLTAGTYSSTLNKPSAINIHNSIFPVGIIKSIEIPNANISSARHLSVKVVDGLSDTIVDYTSSNTSTTKWNFDKFIKKQNISDNVYYKLVLSDAAGNSPNLYFGNISYNNGNFANCGFGGNWPNPDSDLTVENGATGLTRINIEFEPNLNDTIQNTKENIISIIDTLETKVDEQVEALNDVSNSLQNIKEPYKFQRDKDVEPNWVDTTIAGNFTGGSTEVELLPYTQPVESISLIVKYNDTEVYNSNGYVNGTNLPSRITVNDSNYISVSFVKHSESSFTGDLTLRFVGSAADAESTRFILADVFGSSSELSFNKNSNYTAATFTIPQNATKVDVSNGSKTETYIVGQSKPSSHTLYTVSGDTLTASAQGESGNSLTTTSYIPSNQPIDEVINITLNDGQIITANVVSMNENIVVNSFNIGEKQITINTTINKPSESLVSHIIVDSICDSEAYDNAQHVCHVIPVLIN